MILDALFGGGGGGHSTPPSEAPSGNQPSSSDPTAGDTAAPPADNSSQADPIYDEEPGDIDDGTYGEAPATGQDEDQTVETPAEEPAQPEAPLPVEASEPDAPADAAPNDMAAPPVTTTPAPPAAEAAAPAPVPPAAGTPIAADGEEESSGVRDFVTPLLADLEKIRQQQSGETSANAQDARLDSRNRAIAALQDQLATRLISGMSSSDVPTASPSLLDEVAEQPVVKTETTRQPLSLVNRWYAEA